MIKVKELMVKDVITINADESAYRASEIMADNSVSCLIVMEDSKPIGVLSERSLVHDVLLKEKNPKDTRVSDIMKKISTMGPDEHFFSLVEYMRKNNLRRVVIVDKGQLAGIVTETDVVRTSIRLQNYLESKAMGKAKKGALMNKLGDIQFGVRKMSAGYKDLNEILHGGFPYNKSILLVGSPGSGKGLVAFTYMKEGLISKNKVVYICMNEFLKDIEGLFASIGVDINDHLKKGNFGLINMYKQIIDDPKRIFNEEDQLLLKEFSVIKETLLNIIKESEVPIRCVVNVITQSLVLHKEGVVYKFILRLNNLLKENNITSLFFIHRGKKDDQFSVSMEEIMDGVLDFSTENVGPHEKRILTLKKMKPEFAHLPLYYYYQFDRTRNMMIDRMKD